MSPSSNHETSLQTLERRRFEAVAAVVPALAAVSRERQSVVILGAKPASVMATFNAHASALAAVSHHL